MEPRIQVATDTPDGIRTVNKAKPVESVAVERYLEDKFGEALPAVRAGKIELIELRKCLRFRCKSTRRKGELDSTNINQRCIGPE